MAVSASWDDSADDRMTFEDSDRFEEDSLCSLGSENESVGTLTWRGWRKSGTGSPGSPADFSSSALPSSGVKLLSEICAEAVAINYAFEAVEQYRPPVPEQLQLRIAFYSFPKHEDDIRLYSCLANGSMNEFQKGEQFVKHKAVTNVLQIGFHLSGTVTQPPSYNQNHSVSVSFDRGKITSCWCTCQSSVVWCAHVTAVCLLRIQSPSQMALRAPVSESLSRLGRDQLQKFAQYLINELPQQILPTAQKLIDELLSAEKSEINNLQGAPDPTAGASVGSSTNWCLDDEALRLNIRKILGRFSGPAPVAFIDINNFCCTSGAPPAALEWANLMRPLRKKEPEGLWNLLFIVGDLLKSCDLNSTRILEVLTEECLAWPQLIMWWLSSENEDILTNHGYGRHNGHRNNTLPSSDNAKYTSARLLDEHVKLWKIVVMHPCLARDDRDQIRMKFEMWHNNAMLIGKKGLACDVSSFQIVSERFKGFKPAIEACNIDWMEKYQILGFSLDDFVERRTGKDIRFDATIGNLVVATNVIDFTEQKAQLQLDNLCSCAEALYAHGYRRASISLTAQLARELLNSIDNSSGDLSNAVLNRLTTIPSKVAFITEILIEDPSYVPLAFQLALLGLTVPRGAAVTKLQEVRLTDNEIALYSTLKSIPLSLAEIDSVRYKAQGILSGKLSRGHLALPLIFGLYAIEVLGSAEPLASYLSRDKIMLVKDNGMFREDDKILAYKLALFILDERSQASEKKHAMMCEGNRRYRSDLALTLLCHFRNNNEKLRQILNTLLKRERYDSLFSERVMDFQQEEILQFDTAALLLPSAGETESTQEEEGKGENAMLRCHQSTSSDSSDSGNGGGGKDKIGLWRLHQCITSNSSQVVGKRSPKSRQKANKGFRSKRHFKRQKSREHTESDSDSQQSSLNSVQLLSAIDNSEDWEEEATDNTNEAEICCDHRSIEPSGMSVVDSESLKADILESEMDNVSSISFTTADLGLEEENPQQLPSPISDGEGLPLLPCRSGTPDDDALKSSAGTQLELHPLYICYHDGQQADTYPNSEVNTEEQSCISKSENVVIKHIPQLSGQSFDSLSDDEIKEETFDNHKELQSWACSSQPKSCDYVQPTHAVGVDEGELRSNRKEDFGLHGIKGSAETIGAQATDLKRNEGTNLDDLLALSDHAVPPHDENGTCLSLQSKDLSSNECNDVLLEIADDEKQSVESSLVLGEEKEEEFKCRNPEEGALSEDNMSAFLQSLSVEPNPNSTDGLKESTMFTVSPFMRPAMADSISSRKKKCRGNGRPRPFDVRHVAAESFMLFELAKKVLHQSYGQDIFCLGDNDDSRLSNRHRGLQLAAFEIGLFALGLSNLVTPNWMSRTYSSNVSWVTTEANDLGTPALRLINEQWDGVLTPSEVIEIASRAGKSAEPTLARTAAELALSCLPQANSLTPREIEQAIFLCRDQDNDMLERACASIESASHNGGVQPELLFQIARQWHYLHESVRKESCVSQTGISNQGVAFPDQPEGIRDATVNSPSTTVRHTQSPRSVGSGGHHSVVFVTPEQFVQEQMHQQVHEIITRQHSFRWHSLTRCGERTSTPWMYNSLGKTTYRSSFSSGAFDHGVVSQSTRMPCPQPMTYSNDLRSFETPRYLQNAYRVGMKALEGLAARMPDERPESKYAPCPPCSDDIRWLCALAASIGPAHLRQFCAVVVSAVSSPFLLHDLALESARHFALYNPAQLASHLRSPSVSPVVQKCLTIYTELVRRELVKLTACRFDPFVDLLRKTRSAFCMAPGGMAKFNDLLQIIRKTYPRKKDLWQLIMVGLSRA